APYSVGRGARSVPNSCARVQFSSKKTCSRPAKSRHFNSTKRSLCFEHPVSYTRPPSCGPLGGGGPQGHDRPDQGVTLIVQAASLDCPRSPKRAAPLTCDT